DRISRADIIANIADTAEHQGGTDPFAADAAGAKARMQHEREGQDAEQRIAPDGEVEFGEGLDDARRDEGQPPYRAGGKPHENAEKHGLFSSRICLPRLVLS